MTAAGPGAAPAGAAAVPEVTPQQAVALCAAGAVLLDVREQDEWDAGHAEGALHIPLGQLGQRAGGLPAATLVVVCRSGGRSAVAASALAAAGFPARNLAGGMRAWAAEGLAMVSERGGEPAVV